MNCRVRKFLKYIYRSELISYQFQLKQITGQDVEEIRYGTMAMMTDPAVWYGGKVVPLERTVYAEVNYE